MPRIEESIQIAAPPTTVFKLCHDLARWQEWDERVMGVALLSPKPVHRGTLVSVDAGRSGRFLYSWDAEYVDFQFPQDLTFRVVDAAPSSPFKAGTEKWQCTAAGGGTRFTLTWDYQPRNVVARIMDALGRRVATRRAIQRSLANLKTLAEAG